MHNTIRINWITIVTEHSVMVRTAKNNSKRICNALSGISHILIHYISILNLNTLISFPRQQLFSRNSLPSNQPATLTRLQSNSFNSTNEIFVLFASTFLLTDSLVYRFEIMRKYRSLHHIDDRFLCLYHRHRFSCPYKFIKR